MTPLLLIAPALSFLYAVTLGRENTGELRELTCQRVETYVNCQLTIEDVQGNLLMNQTIRRVQKATVLPVQHTRRVCTGSGEDRECSNKTFTICKTQIVADTIPVEIPLGEFKADATGSSTCQPSNDITYAIDSLIKGDLTVKVWTEDTRVGDMKAEFWGIASYILAGAGLFALVGIALSIKSTCQDIWIFDRQQRNIRHIVRYIWWQREIVYALKDVIGLEYTNQGVNLRFRQRQKLLGQSAQIVWGKSAQIIKCSPQRSWISWITGLSPQEDWFKSPTRELIAKIDSYLDSELRIDLLPGFQLESTPTRLIISSTDYQPSNPIKRCVFDLSSGTIAYSRKEQETPNSSPATNRQGVIEETREASTSNSFLLSIQQVNSVQIVTQIVTKYDNEDGFTRSINYYVNLQLIDSDIKQLFKLSSRMVTLILAKRIALFLQVPLNEEHVNKEEREDEPREA